MIIKDSSKPELIVVIITNKLAQFQPGQFWLVCLDL